MFGAFQSAIFDASASVSSVSLDLSDYCPGQSDVGIPMALEVLQKDYCPHLRNLMPIFLAYVFDSDICGWREGLRLFL
jgi:hypothetical protein